jgi:hypothetical protein
MSEVITDKDYQWQKSELKIISILFQDFEWRKLPVSKTYLAAINPGYFAKYNFDQRIRGL